MNTTWVKIPPPPRRYVGWCANCMTDFETVEEFVKHLREFPDVDSCKV